MKYQKQHQQTTAQLAAIAEDTRKTREQLAGYTIMINLLHRFDVNREKRILGKFEMMQDDIADRTTQLQREVATVKATVLAIAAGLAGIFAALVYIAVTAAH